LWSSAQIPRASIRDNIDESLQYYAQFDDLKPNLIQDANNTKRDFYADSIWLSIAYGFDGSLRSGVESKYAYIENEWQSTSLQKQINGEMETTKEYSRYWHGVLVFARPLLTFLNVRQIYILNTIIILGLVAVIILMLVRHKEYGLVWIFVATMLSILAFFAGTSLEYAPAIIVMELASILALRAVCQNRLKTLPYLFFFVGIAVNFVDFLTCETITLTIPLLLVLWLRRHKKMSIISFEKVLRLALFWLAGYVLMWLAKWGISPSSNPISSAKSAGVREARREKAESSRKAESLISAKASCFLAMPLM
jgi:hypothetical protein